uniref:BPTI/Kunitz inhibitor domain-containing protein n=1 Tax=Oreochromis aureus TaxID=47969 RepID=A0AAZ1X0P9_OREAU
LQEAGDLLLKILLLMMLIVSPSSLSVRCRLPMKVGPCRAAFPRFFYNANGNHFESQEECEATCSGPTAQVTDRT